MAALTAIGFTEYEAKVYLALLRDHPATGYQLGKQASIPRSMVYEALGRLHACGAAMKADEQGGSLYRDPARGAAQPPRAGAAAAGANAA